MSRLTKKKKKSNDFLVVDLSYSNITLAHMLITKMVNLNIVLFQSLTGKAVDTNFRVVGLIRLKIIPHTTAPAPKTPSPLINNM